MALNETNQICMGININFENFEFNWMKLKKYAQQNQIKIKGLNCTNLKILGIFLINWKLKDFVAQFWKDGMKLEITSVGGPLTDLKLIKPD